MKKALHDRINRVINTCAFEKILEAGGVCLFEFQADWANYESFDKLPKTYQLAITEGESELAASDAVSLV